MSKTKTEISDSVKLFLDAWHLTVQKKDLSMIDSFITDEVILVSPALFQPKVGKKVVIQLLTDVIHSFDEYQITKTWIDENEIILEFDARVKERKIQGIDKITLNAEGHLVQLKVFIRPFSGLKALIASIVALTVAREESKMNFLQKVMFRAMVQIKARLGKRT
jgi:hypothetical protein